MIPLSPPEERSVFPVWHVHTPPKRLRLRFPSDDSRLRCRRVYHQVDYSLTHTPVAMRARPGHVFLTVAATHHCLRVLAMTPLRSGSERRFHAIGRKRNFANSCAGGIENRVADRCRGQRDRRLSRAQCFRCWTVDENAVDVWHLDSQWEASVTLPVDRSHLTIVPGDFLSERAARSLQYSALDLITQSIGVRNRPTIECDDKSPGLHSAVLLIDFHFCNERTVTIVAFIGDTSDAAPRSDSTA